MQYIIIILNAINHFIRTIINKSSKKLPNRTSKLFFFTARWCLTASITVIQTPAQTLGCFGHVPIGLLRNAPAKDRDYFTSCERTPPSGNGKFCLVPRPIRKA